MSAAQRKAIADYRKRLKRRRMARVEVRVREDDAALIRSVVEALTDPEREREARALLRERFSPDNPKGLKALLAAAPLEGVDLTREQDLGRAVRL